MSTLLGFIGGLATAFLGREVAAYFPAIARWQINRAVSRVPEEFRVAARDKWFEIEVKIPGGLTKVLWGLGCNCLLSRVGGNPATPENVAKLVHHIFFYVYLRLILRDFIRLKFAWPRELRARWVVLKMFADQSLNIDKPDAPQPLLELVDKVQDDNLKKALVAAVEGMRKAKANEQQQPQK
jgi:hypothetical protein